jgi:hypothetical protein
MSYHTAFPPAEEQSEPLPSPLMPGMAIPLWGNLAASTDPIIYLWRYTHSLCATPGPGALLMAAQRQLSTLSTPQTLVGNSIHPDFTYTTVLLPATNMLLAWRA